MTWKRSGTLILVAQDKNEPVKKLKSCFFFLYLVRVECVVYFLHYEPNFTKVEHCNVVENNDVDILDKFLFRFSYPHDPEGPVTEGRVLQIQPTAE